MNAVIDAGSSAAGFACDWTACSTARSFYKVVIREKSFEEFFTVDNVVGAVPFGKGFSKGAGFGKDVLKDVRQVDRSTHTPPTPSSCSVNSFTGDTKVLMADGAQRAIKDIRVGDLVRATDPRTGESGARRVTHLIRHAGPHVMVEVTLTDGTRVNATDGHPFWDVSARTFTDAVNLHPGVRLFRADGTPVPIERVTTSTRSLTAYNLTIQGLHTFYAGQTPVLTHNSGCDPFPGKAGEVPSDELAGAIGHHIDDAVGSRPSVSEIEEALTNGTRTTLPGRGPGTGRDGATLVTNGNVTVVINHEQPYSSTAFYR